mmetsp:Transcript_13017/g.26008  ORF Transcript_13017/g.26008 Transcript_13017/m.26008 type:complete len:161 (-) Transcript_13017:76-558(-)
MGGSDSGAVWNAGQIIAAGGSAADFSGGSDSGAVWDADEPTMGVAPKQGDANILMSLPRIRQPQSITLASSSTPSRSSGRKRRVPNKDIQDDLSPLTHSSTQKRKKGTILYASSLSLQRLKQIQTEDAPRFIKLDFTYCSAKVINKLFPVDSLKYSPVPP